MVARSPQRTATLPRPLGNPDLGVRPLNEQQRSPARPPVRPGARCADTPTPGPMPQGPELRLRPPPSGPRSRSSFAADPEADLSGAGSVPRRGSPRSQLPSPRAAPRRLSRRVPRPAAPLLPPALPGRGPLCCRADAPASGKVAPRPGRCRSSASVLPPGAPGVRPATPPPGAALLRPGVPSVTAPLARGSPRPAPGPPPAVPVRASSLLRAGA